MRSALLLGAMCIAGCVGDGASTSGNIGMSGPGETDPGNTLQTTPIMKMGQVGRPGAFETAGALTLPPEPPTLNVGSTPAGTAGECDVDALSGPATYGNKVKTVLTGLPLTSTELADLTADPSQLGSLIDTWMDTPEFEKVMTTFFATAFQQNELDADGVASMIRTTPNWGRFAGPTEQLYDLFRGNLRESFARTALRIIEEGRPFTEVLTTRSFEMTTAMLVFHGLLEQRYLDDQRRTQQIGMDEVTEFVLYRNAADAPSPDESLNPNSPRFLHFYVPKFDDLCLPSSQDTYTVQQNAFGGNDEIYFLFSTIFGRPTRVYNREANSQVSGNPCTAGNARATPLIRRSDFSDWHTVTFRRPVGDENPTRYYDLASLRNTTEMVTRTDRVGFFTQLGFQVTWPTNEDNAERITINQTLMTSLGGTFDGSLVANFAPTNVDGEHSEIGSACYGCHQTLDPMREVFRYSYSHYYGLQTNQETIDSLIPYFAFQGVQQPLTGVTSLAELMANHPSFHKAWVQKLCFMVNGAACPETTSEFEAVVSAFRSSNSDFKTMLKSLLSSNLTTNVDCLDGSTGYIRSITRRDQLCASLSNRLGVDNICGEGLTSGARSGLQRNVATAVTSMPKDTFARGEVNPLVITETGLFTRASREVVCTVVAESAYGTAFGSLSRDEAIDAMVTRVMGLPVGDARREPSLAVLRDHVTEGMASGASERVALQSALVVACMSPGLAGVGF